ncbi:hypothetical protein [Kordia sp.]|uniref:hypothetical protein n=1 Tax=Kordia sp. TaxID=1965332 RepID=UPI003D2728ED
MSHKKKFLFLSLLLGIGIFFHSCQKDYAEDISEENNLIDSPFSSWIVTEIEYQQNQQLLGRLEALMPSKDDKQTLKESYYDAQNDITIHTEYAKYIEYTDGDLHSYTFSIERSYDTSSILENLVFSYDSDTDSYEAGLATHHFSTEQREEFLSTQHVRTYYDYISVYRFGFV